VSPWHSRWGSSLTDIPRRRRGRGQIHHCSHPLRRGGACVARTETQPAFQVRDAGITGRVSSARPATSRCRRPSLNRSTHAAKYQVPFWGRPPHLGDTCGSTTLPTKDTSRRHLATANRRFRRCRRRPLLLSTPSAVLSSASIGRWRQPLTPAVRSDRGWDGRELP
jgi:hypothetical protein